MGADPAGGRPCQLISSSNVPRSRRRFMPMRFPVLRLIPVRKFAEGDENTAPRQRTTGWESARPDFFADRKIQSPGSHYPMGAQHSVCPAKPAHSGIGDLAGLASAVSILNNGDSEESEEEKREREARENGNAIGAVVGSVIGLLSALDPDCDEDSDETESEENTFGLFM